MDGLALLPVLLNLPPESPACVYDVSADSARPAWTNGAHDALSRGDGVLPLVLESKLELERRIAGYAHSSSATGAVFRLTLYGGAQIHTSIQLFDSRWIVLIGLLTPPPPTFRAMIGDTPTSVGQLILDFDWASTPLGPISDWPQSLRIVASSMLANPTQCCLFWGESKTLLYNDAWSKGSASKPGMMGLAGRIAFSEIWDVFSHHTDIVYTGQAVNCDDDLLFFDATAQARTAGAATSSGHLETYYSWSYVPVHVEDGSVGGIVNNCMETTEKVLSERRTKTVRSLAEQTGIAKTTVEFWKIALDVFSCNPQDMPYVLVYTGASGSAESSSDYSDIDESENSSSFSRNGPFNQLNLVGTLGIVPGHPQACPEQINLASAMASAYHWPFGAACAQKRPLRATNPCPEAFERRGWGDVAGDAKLIPLSNSDGALTGVVVFGLNTRRPYDDDYQGFHSTLVRNLSASLSATQSFEQEIQRTEELRALDRAKTVFFQNVSHELRTPLTLIRGPCEDALRDHHHALDAVNRTRMKLIFRASGRLLRLVNSLMLFSSAEARRLQGHFCPVRLGAVTADMASLFRSAIERAGVVYNVDCGEPDDTHVAYVDLGMWEKIIFNVLSNAVKYTKVGSIDISMVFTNSTMVLRVQDTGCGIPADQLEKVLVRFHRVESSDGRSHEGTGIGLALTSELVKIHRGTIQVQSVLGRGSVFTVKLPLGFKHLPENDVRHDLTAASEEMGSYAASIVEEASSWLGDDSDSTASQGSAPESPEVIENFTILLVEDNADARGYIKSILLNVVANVITAVDGQAALEYVHERVRPDLIVTDVMMPRMSGLQLLAALERDPDPNIQAIPVIVLSARGGSEDENRTDSIFQGPVDFLAKPFSSSELVSRVQTRLRAVRQKNELEKQVRERTRELRVTKQRYQRMSELSPVAIFETEEVDRNVITYANERFFTLTGLPRVLPIDFVDVLQLVAPKSHALAQKTWSEAVNEGKPVHFDFVFANGKNTFVETIMLNDGRLLGTLTDQTEQRRFAAEQLTSERAKADEAVHQRRLQEAFIDIVSHELRNPLSAIIQSADLLSGSVTRLYDILHRLEAMTKTPEAASLFSEGQVELDDASHAVSSVSLCARHQTIIASDILAVSRLDSNLLNINAISFFLQDELHATISMYSVQATAQGIALNLTTGEDIDKDTCLLADPTRFCQILVNLISNSCRILESWEGERRINIDVSLSTERPFGAVLNGEAVCDDGSRVWLVVRLSDSGPGIPLDDQARLFTRFNDINSGDGARRSSSLGGTGLGLYLCKKLAELQGGQIRHSSGPGEGAAFTFFIEARKVVEGGVRRAYPVGPGRASTPVARSSSSTPTPTSTLAPTPKFSPSDFVKPGTDFGNGNLLVPLASPMFEVPRSTMLILIVEDNMINQRLLRRQLERARFQAVTANNGLEALQFLESCLDEHKVYPSVVLMDLEMPILDGLEATRRIREMEKDGTLPASRLPIYAITGNARKGQVDLALVAGMDKVYIKPYKVAEIIEQIDLDGFPR